MIKAAAMIGALAALALALPAQARLVQPPGFVCSGTFLTGGPERGAPIGIEAKHKMTCRHVYRAIARGSWSRAGRRVRFQTRGFRCHSVQLFFIPGHRNRLESGTFACSGAGRSFKWAIAP